ncbi:MAG: nucleotidyltransferase domain-containing protein [Oscillospiraceae bacterium]|nr:nucleotidyltransferase domain-containing protein [Oscillospiraceae bacterium]
MKSTIDKRIVDTIVLASKYPTIKRVGIFGSYARGETDKDSDIDLIYDYDHTDEQSTNELLGYIEEINDLLINYSHATKVDYVWYKGVIESDNPKFKEAVLEDISWLYG